VGKDFREALADIRPLVKTFEIPDDWDRDRAAQVNKRGLPDYLLQKVVSELNYVERMGMTDCPIQLLREILEWHEGGGK